MSMIPDTGSDTKSWWKSRTVIGVAITVGSTVAGLAGYGIPADLQGQAVDLVMSGGALVGAAVSFWGRLKATRTIR